MSNYVFVLDKNKQPLDPTHPAKARKMLKAGRARVFRRYP
ncbi:MAG: RRXRR domain-containing protein, partial [Halothece sp.]